MRGTRDESAKQARERPLAPRGRTAGETLGPWPLVRAIQPSITAKSPLMYALVFVIWLACVAACLPFLLSLVTSPASPWIVGVRIVLVLILWVLWIYGSYSVVTTSFGLLTDVRPSRIPAAQVRDEPVAILYPTYNDFSAQALELSMAQTHRSLRTYILDDSTDAAMRAEVDDFARRHPAVTVIRREDRAGFKAGAMNFALRSLVREPYVVIMDSDEILPPTFVREMLTHFTEDAVGFVQANHDYNRTSATRFAHALGIGIDIHWDVYQPPRNRWGFVMLLGHGAMFRRDVWEKTGGFPEIVSEDLAFATRAAMLGYRGVFAKDVLCLEDFPVDYDAFRKRHRKWTGGTIEYLREEMPDFLRAKAPTWTEKLDVLIPVTQLPVMFLSITSLILIGVLTFTGSSIAPDALAFPWPVAIAATLMMFAPLFATIVSLAHRPAKLFHYATTSMTVYTSVAILSVLHGVRALVDKRSVSFITTPKTSTRAKARFYGATFLFGLAAIAISLRSGGDHVGFHSGMVVGAAGLSWVLASLLPLYNHAGKKGGIARVLAIVPLLVLLAGLAYGVATLL